MIWMCDVYHIIAIVHGSIANSSVDLFLENGIICGTPKHLIFRESRAYLSNIFFHH